MAAKASDTDAADDIQRLVQELDLSVEYVDIAKLVSHGRKTRIHTKPKIKMLAAVMGEFGCLVPIIIDENGKVLAGNARVEAARLLNLKSLPAVRVSHLTEAQKRLFVIADNRMAELAGWDRDALRVEFSELLELDLGGAIELTGFSEVQIEGLKIEQLRDERSLDDVPDAPSRPVSRIGDVWALGRHKLVCGDSSSADVLTNIPEGEVRAVFEDPPYNRTGRSIITDGAHGTFVMGSGEMSDREFTDFLARNLENVRRSLMTGGLAYVCMDWKHMENMLQAGREADLELLNLIIWVKPTGMGSFYRSAHELIFLFRKPGAQHLNRIDLGKNGRDRLNTWSYPSVGGGGVEKAKTRERHATVKPTALVRDALLDCSARGDLVLDFFSGSGTTVIAAEQSGRRAIAVELDPKFVDVGLIRWQDFTGQEARLLATGETFAEVRARRAQETGELDLEAAFPSPELSQHVVRANVRASSQPLTQAGEG